MADQTLKTNFIAAVPFWASLLFVPLIILAGLNGGWWIALIPIFGWWVTMLADFVGGLNTNNPDPDTPEADLKWYRAITIIWPFVQFVVVFGALAYATNSDRLSVFEAICFMAAIGIATGTIGINYAHELMHQKPRWERALGDLLMTMVLYGHFRSEHLLVHHRYVGTPRDPVTARYNEGFHRFFPRVLVESFKSAWNAETTLLDRKDCGPYHLDNSFWRYAIWQFSFLVLAFAIGGFFGVVLFILQAFVAVWQLEMVNYVEHYGLTRQHLGDGKYEHVQPHHSWNAAHRLSNFLLINLQRHSDHHYKPNRRYPLLQTYEADEAPQLPFSYPVMTIMALIPPLWRRTMNPKVREWRRLHYPEVEDWQPYNQRQNPMPS